MELTLTKERDTPLLSRKRYTFDMTFKGSTPSRNDIRTAVAKQLKADEDLTIIKHVYTRYGAEKARVIAQVYNSVDEMKKIEESGTLKKHEKKEEPKKEAAAEAPAEEPKEEAPAEEKAEEAKSE